MRALSPQDGRAVRGSLLLDRRHRVAAEARAGRRSGRWIGSWGSEAGLRRTARLADGWLASAYNTTPTEFALAWAALQQLLADEDKDADTFPNTLATMWFHITDDPAEADQIFRQRLAPTINRPEAILRERLPVVPHPAVRREALRLSGRRRPTGAHLACHRRAAPTRAVLRARAPLPTCVASTVEDDSPPSEESR